MTMRRTLVSSIRRSKLESGRAASATVPSGGSSRSNSGRFGGAGFGEPSAMRLDPVGEQHGVDAVLQGLEMLAAERAVIEGVGVELGLDPARMRRQHQDAAADQDRLLDRVRDEQHGEADVVPELQQLLLHLAPGQRVE